MRKKIDYEKEIGKKYGNLTILSYEKKGKVYFTCKCDCGNITEKVASNVMLGYTTSCGCMRFNSEKRIENARKMGLNTRIHEEKCDFCGKHEHYAKGLCRNCYERNRRNGRIEYLNRNLERGDK